MPDKAPTGKLAPWRFDPVACQADLDAFERLLNAKQELSERGDISPFFRAHPHLSAFLDSYNPNVTTFDRLAVEVGLFGHFAADAVAGDSRNGAYCFVEFEDGRLPFGDDVLNLQTRGTRGPADSGTIHNGHRRAPPRRAVAPPAHTSDSSPRHDLPVRAGLR